jgi:DNA invertase Pin-like site-specific DNA recombinase
MLIGYARVSTNEQNLTLQTDALQEAGCRKIFDDRVSGAASDRPGLKAALEYVRERDTLLVWRLDRLGRSLKDLIEIIGGLEKRGAGFRSL